MSDTDGGFAGAPDNTSTLRRQDAVQDNHSELYLQPHTVKAQNVSSLDDPCRHPDPSECVVS